MFTVCPKCALTLVVTAADLRVAQGYVRCGRCSSVFNALARLTEERQPAAPGEATSAAEAAPAAGAAAPDPLLPGAEYAGQASAPAPLSSSVREEPISEEALEFDAATTDVNSVFVQPAPDPQWTAATGSFRALVAANQDAGRELPDSQVDVEIDAAFLASMLRAEGLDPAPAAPRAPTAPPAPQPAAQPAAKLPAPGPKAPAAAAAAPALPDAPERSAVPKPSPRASASPVAPSRPARAGTAHARPAAAAAAAPPPAPARPAAVAGTEEDAGVEVREEQFERSTFDSDPELPAEAAEAQAPALRWLRAHAWPIGATVAALLLVVQIVNHYRDELAASARFNRPLTSLYGSLGVKLFPHWDLRAYDVRQLGASADTEGVGVITVRASIKNGAMQPQPLPMLRVTLQDRFGNRIAARDVTPKSYLPTSIPPASFLSAGQRIDAEMGFADPGTDAVGFEIDACLPARGGGVACANDATLR